MRIAGRSICIVVATLLVAPQIIAAGDLPWPDYRGPGCDGHAPPAEARGLPVQWSEKTGRNIAWKIDLPGEGHSTPVIGAGRLWFTSATKDGKQQFVVCVDAATGKIVHRKLLFENAAPEPLGNDVNTYASPSSLLEEGAVYTHFGTYGTARLDPKTAEVVWQRRDIRCRHFRGPGSSPVVFEDLLILTFDAIDQQFLMALDKQTGKTVWRTDRSTNYKDVGPDGKPVGDGDLRKAFSTPGLFEVNGRVQVVSVGSKAAFGYDARTGKEIWMVEHDDFNAAARPLLVDGLAILDTGSNGADLLAVRLDSTTHGNITKSHVAWTRSRGNSRLPSPVCVGSRLYMIFDGGVLYCLDARRGKELWGQRLGGNFTASPVVANGLIYLCDERGRTTVVRASDRYDEVARNELSQGMRASPAIADGALYLRTFGRLYKIAAK
jgi:outer membrane protein assembly factor BamB